MCEIRRMNKVPTRSDIMWFIGLIPVGKRADPSMAKKRIWISADHGMAIIYFLQSGLITTLLDAGVEVVLLTDDSLVEKIKTSFNHQGMLVEGLLFQQAREYEKKHREWQWWLNFIRRVGSSRKINVAAQDSYIRQVAVEESNRRRLLMPLAWLTIAGMRIAKPVRKLVRKLQARFTPDFYNELFNRLPPDLVIASTPGWRYDRYLLRAASRQGVPTAAAIVGWDPPSSYGLPGAEVDYITCWSENQKKELIDGSDWPAERVNVGGVPAYDGYFKRQWIIPRDEYFNLHGLDNNRKLITYAASFVSFSPNIQNVQALVDLDQPGWFDRTCPITYPAAPQPFLELPALSAGSGCHPGFREEIPPCSCRGTGSIGW